MTGYLLDAKREKGEACNCGSMQYVDHHLWIGATPDTPKTEAMVAEVSPRSWPEHPSWSQRNTFLGLVDDRSKVRLTGWLTWDEEHPEQLGKTRKTLWEVHPIHKIQVQRASQWVTL
jgi:hypothetical protein